MTEHPITPPPELVQQWLKERPVREFAHSHIATQAARWGSDQELEACVEWLVNTRAYEMTPGALRAARRPKPPSLKQQALEALQRAEEGWRPIPDDCDTIRRALEQLDD